MKSYTLFLRILLPLNLFFAGLNHANAQNGDQILDGIGETSLNARYMFNGDLKDGSRNNLHAKASGPGISFINDERFGKVLSLSAKDDAFLTLPAGVLNDMESLSISGWLYLRSKQPDQYFFDFGNDAGKQIYVAPAGTKMQAGLEIAAASQKGEKKTAISSAITLNKWVYLSIVVDMPSRSITGYVDGKPIATAEDIPSGLTALFGGAAKPYLYIGRAHSTTEPTLDAMIHDLRIYRVALNSTQITGIYKNAQKGNNGASVNTTAKRVDDLQRFEPDHPQLYNQYLLKVSDVEVLTETGNLPRLPSHVTGQYKAGLKGPMVRVIWPSATDNASVTKPGRYTITGSVPGTDLKPKALITVSQAKPESLPAIKLAAFSLSQVSLKNDAHNHQTKFIENRNKFIDTLAKSDPNSFLFMFRHAFGQKQPKGARPLGVWDSEDTKLRGHATGHYLSAIAQAYASTGYDPVLQANFEKKMEYMVNCLYDLSMLSGKPEKAGGVYVSDPTAVPFGPGKADFDSDLSGSGIRNDYWNWGKGFISAYPPDQFIMLEKGAKYGGQKNQIWAPYYTLHKILAGLIDVYEVSGNKKALNVATGMADWVYARLNQLPQETLIKMWNTYIAGEFGGMNESMAHLYQITGKTEYLKTAQLFDNIKVFYGDTQHSSGLAKNVDSFRGLHANQHIPQIVGSIEMYRVSGKPEYYKVADNFWHKATDDYMYSIGGVAGARNPANAECFISQPSTIYENGFSEGGQNETCATYNMLKLTGDLFLFDQRAELMDYYERGLYNHILASVAEHSPANTYHVPLRPGSVKQFGNADMTGFTCCNGTAIESSTKLQNSIYFRDKDNSSLYVNLYVPSVLDWTEKKIKVEQTTDFPNEDETRLKISGSGSFDVNVRVPGWATNGFFVKINGRTEKTQAKPGSYLKISRQWKDGDIIELKMPFGFHLDPVMDQQNIASLFYGPVLLAAQEPSARKDWRKVTLEAGDIGKTIQGDPKLLEFTIDGILYKPFYQTYGRHSVYLNVTLK
ncbi:beta-L-arabinofuranosidase domain-containing protein [Pedobacter psychrodurus]|uniref:beta-L-arabinofuranosidase domain-containing protein n=1 Tax=Pedobacter psychrodurus TaxID=2530456 RepID=UPI00292CBAA2|nr:beta-L-arabinofuranosidase domain-containing protein [Pedobacter psychrodurus]